MDEATGRYLHSPPFFPPHAPAQAPIVPINCVGSFVALECSQTCGGGIQKLRFTITIFAQNGGTACLYPEGFIQTISCHTEPCRMLLFYCPSPLFSSPFLPHVPSAWPLADRQALQVTMWLFPPPLLALHVVAVGNPPSLTMCSSSPQATHANFLRLACAAFAVAIRLNDGNNGHGGVQTKRSDTAAGSWLHSPLSSCLGLSPCIRLSAVCTHVWKQAAFDCIWVFHVHSMNKKLDFHLRFFFWLKHREG